MNYQNLRKKMVDEQIVARGIRDRRLIDVLYKIERHRFVPQESRSSSYGDFPLPIGGEQTISQPYMVALMTACLSLKGDERVLEIGTGSGYQTAILAELSKEVYSVERIESLAKRAQELLRELGYANIKIKIGDGTLGWSEEAPFERIIVTAANSDIPPPLIEQLKEEGIMVIPLGDRFSQILTVVKKTKDQIIKTEICSCVFVPLIGKYGF
ncbi:MAG: protein-L-isoaspartate(D-aspartate) O-methyltransferase [Candidatus Omnitrophica bacterium]|nr:protein-L-isoaspartate(D-aspartate) O-methyltransferase [Candidatus Omnitrophota bacterium]